MNERRRAEVVHVRALLERQRYLDGRIKVEGRRGYWVREIDAITWAINELDPDGAITDAASKEQRA